VQIFNNYLDAVVAGLFLVLVAGIVVISVVEWALLAARLRSAKLAESEPVWLPDYAVAETQPVKVFGLIALGCALLRELSGEAQLDRARVQASACACHEQKEQLSSIEQNTRNDAENIYLEETQRKFERPNRCC
jgi:hypothetical protein